MSKFRQDANTSESSTEEKGWQILDLDTLSETSDTEIEIETKEPQQTPSDITVESEEAPEVQEEKSEADETSKDVAEASLEDVSEPQKASRAEKRIKQLLEEKKRVASENEELRRRLLDAQEVSHQSKKKEVEVRKETVTGQIVTVRQQLEQAIKNADVEAQVDLQDKLAELKVQKMALEALDLKTEKSDISPKPSQAQPQANPREAVINALPDAGKEWVSKNKWFMVNETLTKEALGIAQEVESEGYSPEEPEYYEQVEIKLAEMYPSRFGKKPAKPSEETVTKEEPKKPATKQTVSSTTKAPVTNQKPGTIRLSQQDVALANKWGISLQEYARQKKLSEDAEKNNQKETYIF